MDTYRERMANADRTNMVLEAQQGNQMAWIKIMNRNNRFIEKKAQKIAELLEKEFSSKVDLQDLIQAGQIGLFQFVKNFKEGDSFNRIDREIVAAMIEEVATMAFPVTGFSLASIKRYIEACVDVYPLYDFLVNEEGMSSEDAICEVAYRKEIPVSVVEEDIESRYSYSKLVFTTEEYEDKIVMDDAMLFDGIFQRELSTIISNMIDRTLTEREQRVIELRFFEIMSLRRVGEFFGVKKERIRQIEAKALRKLRSRTLKSEYGLIHFLEDL